MRTSIHLISLIFCGLSIFSPCLMPKGFQASRIMNELKIMIRTPATNIVKIKIETKSYTKSDFQWRCSFQYKRINELWKIYHSPLALSCFLQFRCASNETIYFLYTINIEVEKSQVSYEQWKWAYSIHIVNIIIQYKA